MDHDRSSHAERQALLVIIAMLQPKKGRDRFGDLVLVMHLGFVEKGSDLILGIFANFFGEIGNFLILFGRRAKHEFLQR